MQASQNEDSLPQITGLLAPISQFQLWPHISGKCNTPKYFINCEAGRRRAAAWEEDKRS